VKNKLAILGSTGSIGTQTLQLVDMYPESFSVSALSTNANVELLLEQIIKYKPSLVCVVEKTAAQSIKSHIPDGTTLLCGEEGLLTIADMEEADTLVVAVVGIAGLPAVMKGIASGKRIALANKEALVTGGALVTEAIKARGDIIYPIDSEHSAIFQCLNGENHKSVKRLILTASGGPFRNTPIESFEKITVAQALKHPNWNMGRKITIDSATLMNKGLEVIEAHWLFDMPCEKIDVVIHPESIIHSMVEFCDNSFIAQLGNPDMRLPIMYALNYPNRMSYGGEPLDLVKQGALSFSHPDHNKFPCLSLAYTAINIGGTAPTVLNAANEVAVEWFLSEKIGFCDIPVLIEHTILNTEIIKKPTIEDIYATDKQVREHLSKTNNWRKN